MSELHYSMANPSAGRISDDILCCQVVLVNAGQFCLEARFLEVALRATEVLGFRQLKTLILSTCLWSLYFCVYCYHTVQVSNCGKTNMLNICIWYLAYSETILILVSNKTIFWCTNTRANPFLIPEAKNNMSGCFLTQKMLVLRHWGMWNLGSKGMASSDGYSYLLVLYTLLAT